METVRVQGRHGVAALLREIANGIEAGYISLGGEKIGCSEDLAAVVSSPDAGLERLLLVSLRFELPGSAVDGLAVERELAHPGD